MAVTDYQSLYGACKKVALDGSSSIQSIGGFDTFIELHNQDDIDNNYSDIVNGNYDSNNNLITKCTFGSDSDQSHIILISSDNVEIPENYTLTPVNPKKSLVILCNKFINNGTVSMYAKGPNILPHEYYIIGQTDGYDEDIIIPAYANNGLNGVSYGYLDGQYVAANGNNGVNRQCGSGGQGSNQGNVYNVYIGASGSGYAFGGGAGSGGAAYNGGSNNVVGYDVSTEYPMRATSGNAGSSSADGGVGNPSGSTNNNYGANNIIGNNFGVGGRIIIFCTKFENNGTITVNGTDTRAGHNVFDGAGKNWGGASGGGAIDIFYSDTITEEGIITANGGNNFTNYSTPGKGGNGSITFTQYNASAFILPGYANKETIGEVIRLTKLALKEKVAKDELASLILEDTYTSLTKTYSSQKIEEAILALIDDTQVASMLTNKTLSSQMIQSLMPKLVSQLENDKGYIAREISAVEVNNIWDNIFGV